MDVGRSADLAVLSPNGGGRAMKVDGRELHQLVAEQRLLRDVVRLTRRCEGPAPRCLVDAVLAGTSAVRPALPAQRSHRST